jgi:hypothetical protein
MGYKQTTGPTITHIFGTLENGPWPTWGIKKFMPTRPRPISGRTLVISSRLKFFQFLFSFFRVYLSADTDIGF